MTLNINVRPTKFDFLDAHGYSNVLQCHVSGIYAALCPLITTTALVFDLGDSGYAERYCFQDFGKAYEELYAWHARHFNDQRPIGWRACRGVSSIAIKQSFAKYYGPDYAQRTLDAHNELPEDLQGYPSKAHISKMLNVDDETVFHELAYLRVIGKVF